jgi:aryl-alcohol dehydrogenase-like predicted oxidoreductase
MRYTKLGTSGLTLSRVGLGCASYGESDAEFPAGWALNEDSSEAHFRRALDAGINYFDTADKYSLGRSEKIVGRWLGELARRDEIVVSTKVFHPMGQGPNRGGLSRKHILEACDASLQRLKMDYIDLYVIHHWDFFTPIEETMDALDSLVRAGKVRYLGASGFTAWQLAKSVFIAQQNGWHRFVSHSCHYNLLYREAEHEIIPLCIDQDLGVTAWRPLAKGALAEGKWSGELTARARNDPWSRVYDPDVAEAVFNSAKLIAKSHGVTTSQVALAWLLQSAGVDAAIVGCTSVEQIDQAVKALDLELTAPQVASLEAPYRPRTVQGHDEPTPAQLAALKAGKHARSQLDWVAVSRLGPDQCQ